MSCPIRWTALILTLLLSLTACEREDDIGEIFNGKTWYMNGASINGMRLNDDIRQFYTPAGRQAYRITFTESAFTATLEAGCSFAGTWTADGKRQIITLQVTSQPPALSVFDRSVYNIITHAVSYESGASFLKLKQDAGNYILLGDER